MPENEQLTEETKTLITILRHQGFVRKYLRKLASALENRATIHDLSKFSQDEFGGFVDIQRIARTTKYNSEQYRESIDTDPVKLHFSRNPHHPEHYSNGIDDMSLLDIIEMVIDWQSAAETYGQSSFEESLPEQVKRFKLRPEHLYLIKLIAEELKEK